MFFEPAALQDAAGAGGSVGTGLGGDGGFDGLGEAA